FRPRRQFLCGGAGVQGECGQTLLKGQQRWLAIAFLGHGFLTWWEANHAGRNQSLTFVGTAPSFFGFFSVAPGPLVPFLIIRSFACPPRPSPRRSSNVCGPPRI